MEAVPRGESGIKEEKRVSRESKWFRQWMGDANNMYLHLILQKKCKESLNCLRHCATIVE